MAERYTPRQQVLDKIAQCFKNQPKKLALLHFYIYTLEENMVNRLVEVLHPLINNEEAFKDFLCIFITKIEDSKTCASLEQKSSSGNNDFSLAPVIDRNHWGYKDLTNTLQKHAAVHSFNLIRAFNSIPVATRNQLLKEFGTIVHSIFPAQNALMAHTTGALKLVKSSTGKALATAAIVLTVTYDIYKQINRWWNGDISGERCAKNIIDNLAATAGGLGGGWGGAAIGTYIYPGIGTIVGAIIGGVFGSFTANALSELLTEKIFNVPKEEALENAYRFLVLSYGASNDEINSKYRQLALKYHPDKDGNPEKFHQLQYYVAIIKASKGE